MDTIRSRLAHVFWIGGSPCAGKSSVANLLAATYPVRVVHGDDMSASWGQRIQPDDQPVLHKWTTTSWDQLWSQPTDILLDEAIAGYREHAELIRHDLLDAVERGPVVVEATALLPEFVSSVLTQRHRGIWLVPSEEFQRRHYRARGEWVDLILGECSDPDRAFANWMARDAAFARWVALSARDLGLRVVEIDGSSSIPQTSQLVARHFRLDGDDGRSE